VPDFEIEGNPGNIRAKALVMEQKGQLFYDTGDALGRIDVSGWTGRAADEFREAHDLEPDRWIKAGNGFRKAAAGLTTYAGELENARSRAEWAREEYERGQRESESARTQYSGYMDRMRSYWSSGGTDQAEPFVDWGDPIQQKALQELQSARADLEAAAHVCAGEVRAGCADAPEEPNWLESGLAFVGGIFEGAGEAVWDLLTMVPFSPVNMVIDSYKLATGALTPEELAKKYELSAENAWDMAQGIYAGLTTDPVGFGKNLGKSLLDWDTWADDPARAIGHLVPDVVATIATGGAGASLKALRGLDGLHDVSLLARPLHGLTSLRGLDLGDLAGLSKMDDLALGRHLDGLSPADQARLLRRGEAPELGTMSDVFGRKDFVTDFGERGIPDSWSGSHTAYASVPRNEPLVNLHAEGSKGSGTFWTDTREALTQRTETQAMDRLALEKSWYPDGNGGHVPRDEITVRDFSAGDGMRVQEGTIGPQDTTLGGATQHVMGLDEPFYTDGAASQWTGPAPWVSAVPEGAWAGFGQGAAAGLGTSVLAGAAAEESGP
jgi:hypothetical protein